MEGVLAGVFRMAQNRESETNLDKQLLSEIDSVRQSLDMVATRFNSQNDPDLLEECIYEMQALSARYRYLTREARRQGITGNNLLNLQRLN